MTLLTYMEQLNDKLNASEALLCAKVGEKRVRGYIRAFKRLAKADPSLYRRLYRHHDPYAYVRRVVDRRAPH